VIITGNLTRDPEQRSLPSGTVVCNLRVASNSRRKDPSTGEWVEKANYFDVTVWGAQAESCARFLSKGRPVAIDGRLDWREFETRDGQKRQAVEIVAEHVQFLGSGDSPTESRPATPPTRGSAPPASASDQDDDIPF
jgi:single-strand DNA-binding protein